MIATILFEFDKESLTILFLTVFICADIKDTWA